MKKTFFILFIVVFLIIIILGYFIINYGFEKTYERTVDNIKSDLVLNESHYNDIVTAVKKSNLSESSYINYAEDTGVTTDANIDSRIIAEILKACKALQNPPESIIYDHDMDKVILSYTLRRGLDHYMQVNLIYIEDLSKDYDDVEVITGHWVIKVYGLV